MLKGDPVAHDFFPFVENEGDPNRESEPIEVTHPARIAVYDDVSAAPRVLTVQPGEVRAYLEEITATVSRLSKEQGGNIPFMVIREIVENFIHAYFESPTITILDGGNTIRFSDQGPGIREKDLALEFGTTSATEEMKRYIRGVGSGLPYVQQYMADKGGSLEVEDNISGGTVVTISTHPAREARAILGARDAQPADQGQQPQQPQPWGWPQQGWGTPWPVAIPPESQRMVPQPQTAPQTYPVPWNQTVTQKPPIQLDERQLKVLEYLSIHESVGPTDLVGTYASSGATWSRTLSSLAAQGIVSKKGQKYHLTGIGRSLI